MGGGPLLEGVFQILSCLHCIEWGRGNKYPKMYYVVCEWFLMTIIIICNFNSYLISFAGSVNDVALVQDFNKFTLSAVQQLADLLQAGYVSKQRFMTDFLHSWNRSISLSSFNYLFYIYVSWLQKWYIIDVYPLYFSCFMFFMSTLWVSWDN